MTSKAEEIANNLLESFASKPELLPQSFESVTWDTPGVGSIDIEEFAQRIVAALREYGAEVRKRDAEVCRTHQPKPLTVGGIIERESCAAAIEREELP